ncbi:MAG: amidohydrolase family protein [Rhizobiales bacterium]|nr:amidohydrolase family protein [Hyphomicrobiales bacterium]
MPSAPHRIDTHHHFLPPDYVRIVGREAIGSLIVSGEAPDWRPSHSIDVMDRHGIATAVLSMSAPGVCVNDREATRALCRHCNEYAARMRSDYLGRFGLFACLPLPDVEASLREITFAFDELGADGIGLLTSYGDRYPGDPEFAPVFDELNRRGAVVYFHPTVGACNQCLKHIPAATLDFPFDTTRAVTDLLFSGTLARCQNIRFIFSHAGGTIPFLAERIARLEVRPQFKRHVPDGAINELRRLYFDTALSANAYSISGMRQLVSDDRILFGSDYPFAPESTTTASVKALASLGLDAGTLRKIERDNALSLMPGLEAAAVPSV